MEIRFSQNFVQPWTDWEEENLIKGVRRYGKGCWAMILDQYRFQNRSAIMLKDKFRSYQLFSCVGWYQKVCSSNQLPLLILACWFISMPG